MRMDDTLKRIGDNILDKEGRSVAIFIHGWWYKLGKDSLGVQEYQPLDPDDCKKMNGILGT